MPHARTTDPETSHEAARSVKNLTQTQENILRIFNKYRRLTDEMLLRYYRGQYRKPAVSDSGLRSRRAELVARGLLEDSGLRSKMNSGRNAIMWERASND